MNALSSAGIFALAYVIGRLALVGGLAPELRRRVLARNALAFVMGIALLTPPLVVAAGMGLFDVRILGIVAWVGAGIGLWRRPAWPAPRQRIDSADAIVLLATVTFAIVAASGRDETLGAGRDQQIYAESALALSERAHAWTFYAPLDDLDRTLLRSLGGVEVPGLSRMRNAVDRPIRPTHSLGWPVWLALAYSSFGVEGIYAANAVVFAIGGLLFFVVLRRLVPPGIAVAATCFLLALPSSLWIAGISLSEPLAMTLLLAVPLVGSSGLYRSRWTIAALMLAAALVRIDSALLVPAAIGAAILASVTTSTIMTGVARRFALIQIMGLAIGLVIYMVLFPGYLYSVLQETAAITAVSLALTLTIALLKPGMGTGLHRAIDSRPSRLLAIAVLISLFAYAAVVRPTLQPFSIIRQVSGLDGQRDFREDSLLNLAEYVSWPILLFALGGVCYAIQRNWAARRGLFRPLLLVVGIGPALLYLWSPQVSPDHPWAIRRFVPTIIPYVVLFAALFVHGLTRRLGRLNTAVGAVALIAPYALLASDYPPQRLLIRENQGMTNQLNAINRELPEGLIVDVGADENVTSALVVAYGKPLAIIDATVGNSVNIDRVTTWIQDKARWGRPAWLLHGPKLWRTGANISQQREWWIRRQILMPANRPPATGITTLESQLILSRFDGLDATFATRMFGGERIWGAHEGGFFESEVAPFGQFRYTNGLAWIEVPAFVLRGAEALKVDVFSYAKQGVSRWMSVQIDGRPAWTGEVGAGVNTLRVPLSGTSTKSIARIEILSEGVDAADMNADDRRVDLSIGLIGIRPLHVGEPRTSGPGIQGFRSKLAPIGLSPEPQRVTAGHVTDFVLDVSNTGTEFWPSLRELGDPKGAVQIALRWYRRGKFDAFVGDNRWSLSVSMLPGDRTRLRVPLAPIGLNGKPLPAGEYVVRVGMVRETIALFADNGDAVLSIPVVLEP